MFQNRQINHISKALIDQMTGAGPLPAHLKARGNTMTIETERIETRNANGHNITLQAIMGSDDVEGYFVTVDGQQVGDIHSNTDEGYRDSYEYLNQVVRIYLAPSFPS